MADDPFDSFDPPRPARIGEHVYTLTFPDPESGQPPDARFSIVRIDQRENALDTIQGTLIRHLTNQEVQGLLALYARLFAKSERDLIP